MGLEQIALSVSVVMTSYFYCFEFIRSVPSVFRALLSVAGVPILLFVESVVEIVLSLKGEGSIVRPIP